MAEHDFKVGDIVRIVRWGAGNGDPIPEDECSVNGLTGPITRIFDQETILVDVGVPGVLMNDLICYPIEIEKVENNG